MSTLPRVYENRRAVRLLPQEDPEFQVAPMIDILLVLLVFFMAIATEQVVQKDPELILPVAKSESIDESKELWVMIRWRPGQAEIIELSNKGVVDAAGLTSYIKERKAREAETGWPLRVVIRADRRARYQTVRAAMDAIAAAGEARISFSVADKEQP